MDDELLQRTLSTLMSGQSQANDHFTSVLSTVTVLTFALAPALPALAKVGLIPREALLDAMTLAEGYTMDPDLPDLGRSAVQTILNYINLALEVAP